MTAPVKKQHRADGWSGRLRLEYGMKNSRTILRRNSHQGPLMVQRPLYPEGNVCHTCILHPPGGVVGGDRLEIDVLADQGASALLTTPGATKFYRSDRKTAVQRQHLRGDADSVIEWFPQENILFPGAEATITTRVDLNPTARFMGWEILCLGLPTNDLTFNSGRVDALFGIYREDNNMVNNELTKNIQKPIFLDRLRITGAGVLSAGSGLRGFPVSGTFVATNCGDKEISALRKLVCREEQAIFGVTLADGLLIARYLGRSTFACRELFITVWQLLRPAIAGRTACAPRIWAT